MPAPLEITPAARALLEGPHLAHLATVRRDRTPSVHPVWIGTEGNHVLVCTGRRSAKTRNVEHDPHVALSIVNQDNPYEELLARGVVVEVRNDIDLVDMDPIAHVYTGKAFPYRGGDRVTIVIELTWIEHRVLPFEHTPGSAP
jgi:PPOX class probable F420-dependent enzyme